VRLNARRGSEPARPTSGASPQACGYIEVTAKEAATDVETPKEETTIEASLGFPTLSSRKPQS
jgi:hypothetical protein